MNVPQIGSVSFNGKKIEQELDGIVQKQLPYIAMLTVRALGKQVIVDLRKEMRDSFRFYSRFTDQSLATSHKPTKTELWTDVYHKEFEGKGNAAANYLRPQVLGGMVYRTRFQNRLSNQLSNYNGRYMLPLLNSPAAKLNKDGRIQAGQYTEALYGVKAMNDVIAKRDPGDQRGVKTELRAEGKYFYVPRDAIKPNRNNSAYFNKGKPLSSGIYRVVRKSPVQLFQQLDAIPTVQKRYDFKYAAELSIQKNAVSIFNDTADRVLKADAFA